MQKLCAALETRFDYCVLDLSPGFSGMEKATLVAADEAVAVCLLDGFSLDGLDHRAIICMGGGGGGVIVFKL
jgi:cellulose biosynthesis protein BcsQ